eukprot:jgi/Chlat1/7100/Chrsp57S06731
MAAAEVGRVVEVDGIVGKEEQILHGVHLLYGDKVAEAEVYFEARQGLGTPFALHYAEVATYKALLSCVDDDVDKAIGLLRAADERAASQASASSSSTASRIVSYFRTSKDSAADAEEAALSKLEAHCIQAETHLMVGLLMLIKASESWTSIPKASYSLRKAWLSYQKCLQSLEQLRTPSRSREMVAGAVHFGVGLFNMLVSLIPPGLITFAEFLGFSADRDKGLSLLQKSASSNSSRAFVAAFMLMQYHTVLSSFLPFDRAHCAETERLLASVPAVMQQSSVVKVMAVRLARYKSQPDQALALARVESPAELVVPQLKHVRIYELAWCALAKKRYDEAAQACDVLIKESSWSKAFSAYFKACCLWQLDSIGEARRVAATVSGLVKRAKAPIEHIADKRAKAMLNSVPLFPALELASFWNVFQQMSRTTLQEHVTDIGAALTSKGASIPGRKEEWSVNDEMYCRYLRGVCFRCLDQPQEALLDLRAVVEHKGSALEKYLVPWATYEYGSLLMQDPATAEAGRQLLKQATAYKPHDFQSRLKFIVQERLRGYKKSL